MLDYEMMFWDKGLNYIAGVDEVGRGCLFGDVVAAAVILPKGERLDGVDDSKKLSEKKREQLFELIYDKAIAIGIGRVDAATIDQINIKQASRLAMKRAVDQLKISPEQLLVDAEQIDCPIPQMALIHGDALSQSIAATSIVAKVTRDRMCLQWDMEFPEYGLSSHKGYATKAHREMLIKHGPSPKHRKSFLNNIFAIQQELF